MMRTIFFAVAAVYMAGCDVGVYPLDPPPPDMSPQALFDANVYPILGADCGSCHSAAGPSGNLTGFVATSASKGYVTATGFQSLVGDWTQVGAPILRKISGAGGHHGVAPYTADETSKITAWLNAELAVRAGGTTPPPMTGDDSPAAQTVKLTSEWSGCMTLENFTAANMTAWGDMPAENSACKTCHINGEYGQIASDVADSASLSFFKTISTNRYYMAQYFSVDLVNKQMITNTRSLTSVGQGGAPHTEHPRFMLENSTGLAALQAFYNKTMALKTAGTCGAPTLTN
jgi:hypothetical protein